MSHGVPLLEVEALRKVYRRRGPAPAGGDRIVEALAGVSFAVGDGESVGLVGESGCGKTTLARLLVRLEPPTSGGMRYRGQEVRSLRGEALRRYRRRVQIAFQDPYGSLNPRLSVGSAIREVLDVHRLAEGASAERRVSELLDLAGLESRDTRRYPHELSGGQRQRVGIARALAVEPDLLIADEPVSALDVSVQAQILNLFLDLRDRLGLTYLFISHDLAVVRQVCRSVLVMKDGGIVEAGPADEVFERPEAPYTRALLAAVPRIGFS